MAKDLIADVFRPETDEETAKSLIFLRGYLNGGNSPLILSREALELAIRAHGDARRDDGALYISHPARMACKIIGYNVRSDVLIATALLHDVCEDCGIPIQNVSSSSEVRDAVRHMTISPKDYEHTKADLKTRYMTELSESKEALICKVLDRIDNLDSMIGVFDRDRALKFCRETIYLLYPQTSKAKNSWPEYSNLLTNLRAELRSHLKWAKYAYKFTDQELNTPYGGMEFEQKSLKE